MMLERHKVLRGGIKPDHPWRHAAKLAVVAVAALAVACVVNATPPRRGTAMWETKETLEGGLRIDRWWWVIVKGGALVVTAALVGIGMALAFL